MPEQLPGGRRSGCHMQRAADSRHPSPARDEITSNIEVLLAVRRFFSRAARTPSVQKVQLSAGSGVPNAWSRELGGTAGSSVPPWGYGGGGDMNWLFQFSEST